MKEKIIFITALILVVLPVLVFAQESIDLPKPGLTPDSPFYFFDSISKKISLFFTFSQEKKAEKALQFAEERLVEIKIMADKNKTKFLAAVNQGYQEFLNLANQKIQEAKKSGKDIEELAILITEKTLKHQEVLIKVFEKVPEEAKTYIEEAIKASRKGSEDAVRSVTGVKKDELLQKIEEARIMAEERINALEEKIKSLEQKLEEMVATAEAEAERLKRGVGAVEEVERKTVKQEVKPGEFYTDWTKHLIDWKLNHSNAPPPRIEEYYQEWKKNGPKYSNQKPISLDSLFPSESCLDCLFPSNIK